MITPTGGFKMRNHIPLWKGESLLQTGPVKPGKNFLNLSMIISGSCWVKTGCLLTADGSDDNMVKPEGLDGYKVPPPTFCNPNSSTPSSNNPPEIQIIDNEQEVNAWLPVNELVEPDDAEAEEERIFDIIDGFLLD